MGDVINKEGRSSSSEHEEEEEISSSSEDEEEEEIEGNFFLPSEGDYT